MPEYLEIIYAQYAVSDKFTLVCNSVNLALFSGVGIICSFTVNVICVMHNVGQLLWVASQGMSLSPLHNHIAEGKGKSLTESSSILKTVKPSDKRFRLQATMATPPRNRVTMSPSGPARLNAAAADADAAADQPDVVWSNRPRVLDIGKSREQLSLPNIGQLNNNAQCKDLGICSSDVRISWVHWVDKVGVKIIKNCNLSMN